MLANAATFTLHALRPNLRVLAEAASTALGTQRPPLSVFAKAAPTALWAPRLDLLVLTDASPTAVHTEVPLLSVLAVLAARVAASPPVLLALQCPFERLLPDTLAGWLAQPGRMRRRRRRWRHSRRARLQPCSCAIGFHSRWRCSTHRRDLGRGKHYSGCVARSNGRGCVRTALPDVFVSYVRRTGARVTPAL